MNFWNLKCYLIWRVCFFFYLLISIIYILTTVLKTIMIMYYCCIIYLDNLFLKCQEYKKKISSGFLMDNFCESNQVFSFSSNHSNWILCNKETLWLCKWIGWFCFDQNFLNKFTYFSSHISNKFLLRNIYSCKYVFLYMNL